MTSVVLPYYKNWLGPTEATTLFETLSTELPWQEEWVFFFQRKVKVPRLVVWIGDDHLTYTYSRVAHRPHPWPAALLTLRQRLREEFNQDFNGVLGNFYRDGSESVGWHQDREPEIDPDAPLMSLSLGAARFFSYRSIETRQSEKILLESGSLLMMTPDFNKTHHHALLKTKRVTEPRLNFTFRVMQNLSQKSKDS